MSAAQEGTNLLPSASSGEVAKAIHVCFFAGGVFCLGPVAHTLIVFTGGKIAQDPTAFPLEDVAYCQMLFWIGWAAASALLMPAMDGFGRKAPCYSLLGVAFAAGVISTRATRVWLYAAAMFVIGFTLPPSGQIAYLLIQETVTERQRASTLVGLNIAFSLVIACMAVCCGYVTRMWSWRLETLLWWSPMLLLLLAGPVAVAEPPRPASGSSSEAAERGAGAAMRMVFGPGLRMNMALTCMCWTSASVSFYGLSYSAGELSPDIYLNVLLFALMDIVGSFIPAPMVDLIGVKHTQAVGFAGTSATLLCAAALREGSWAMVGCALMGRLCVDIAFSTVFLLIVDCFPSDCRAAALGVANVASRLLTFAAPLCADAPARVSCAVLGCLCAAAVGATLALDVPSGSRTVDAVPVRVVAKQGKSYAAA